MSNKYASRKKGVSYKRCRKLRHVQDGVVTVSIHTIHGVYHVMYDLADESLFDWRRLSITGDPNKRAGQYVRVRTGSGDDCRQHRLNRLITGCPRDLVADHVNGNRMDHRRCNLDVVTQRENVQRYFRSRKAA